MEDRGARVQAADAAAEPPALPAEQASPGPPGRNLDRETVTSASSPVAAPYVDLPLRIEVELDRKAMTVREILRLRPGSVLRMTRSAGENIDIRVGGALMGFGEIVILEERMGVRITDFHEIE
jgi:flagellar motor switch protein FliN/FliY